VRNSVLLAAMTAAITLVIAVVIIFAVRLAPTRTRRIALRAGTVGYAVPGSVAAAGVFIVADWLGGVVGTVLTASLGALVIAYCVRFTTLALQAGEARMESLPRTLDTAARSLGAGPARLLGEVHLPLLVPALATGAVLVFVEVVKELPATALLRPFGLDTLPIAVWEATKESLYETASLPALLLLVVSMGPVAFLVRRDRPGREHRPLEAAQLDATLLRPSDEGGPTASDDVIGVP
jgi:iron(III) transport system permease protein